jgi:hypothetical protein
MSTTQDGQSRSPDTRGTSTPVGSQATQHPHVATAYIVEPGGPANRYSWDAAERSLEFDGVVAPEQLRGADLARLPMIPPRQRTQEERQRPVWAQLIEPAGNPESSASLGPSLLAFLLSRVPHPPNTRLQVRLLGAVYAGVPKAASGTADAPAAYDDLFSWIAIAVPLLDGMLAGVTVMEALPDAQLEQLRQALTTMLPSAGNDLDTLAWLDAKEIAAWYRDARRYLRLARRTEHDAAREMRSERLFARPEPAPLASRGRLAARMAEESGSPEPGWRETTPLSPAEVRARGMAAFAEAEHLLRWLPTRFERYVAELVLPDEEILFFTELPALTVRG